MSKRQKKNRTSLIASPVSPLAPPEAQSLGRGITGFLMALDLFWSGITGKYKDPWYDRVLHVVGGMLLVAAFVGGGIKLFLELWNR